MSWNCLEFSKPVVMAKMHKIDKNSKYLDLHIVHRQWQSHRRRRLLWGSKVADASSCVLRPSGGRWYKTDNPNQSTGQEYTGNTGRWNLTKPAFLSSWLLHFLLASAFDVEVLFLLHSKVTQVRTVGDVFRQVYCYVQLPNQTKYVQPVGATECIKLLFKKPPNCLVYACHKV